MKNERFMEYFAAKLAIEYQYDIYYDFEIPLIEILLKY